MIKIAIVEEGPQHIKRLKQLITRYCPDFRIIGQLSEINNADDWIRENNPDVVFLNLDYPRKASYRLLHNLSGTSHEFVLLTEGSVTPAAAYKHEIIDCLCKPVKDIDLLKVHSKVVQKMMFNDIRLHIAQLMVNSANLGDIDRNLAIPTLDGYVFMNMDEIIRLEASGAYTFIHCSNGVKTVSSRNIKEYEMQLPPQQFCRVHNSHIVNIRHLRKYEKGRGGTLILNDSSRIVVSTRKKTQFLNMFKHVSHFF